jgi:serine/threonine protein kinase
MFEPGTCLYNRYEISQLLSRKAGRRTLLAYDQETQTQVIIKVLLFEKDFEWDDLKLFKREAATLKILNHPSIPRYLDFFELKMPHNQGFALVQNYIAAKSLEQHLQGGETFSEVEVRELAKVLLEILIYLHKRHPPVLHRDIKPSNILIDDRSENSIGKVYLVDFGSVQTLSAQIGATITIVGTYGYMPPEQFGGRAVPASDLYALGATMIHLITGIHPAELPKQNLQIQFPKQFHNTSSDFENWLLALTEPALEQRIDNANQALKFLCTSGSSGSNLSQLNSNYIKKRVHHFESYDLVVEKAPNSLNIHKKYPEKLTYRNIDFRRAIRKVNLKLLFSKKNFNVYLALISLLLISLLGLFSVINGIQWLAFIIFMPMTLTFSLAIGTMIYLIVISLSSFLINTSFNPIIKLITGKSPGLYIKFDARNDSFEFCNYESIMDSPFGLPFGKGKVSDIQCVMAIKTTSYPHRGRQIVMHNIIIQSKKRIKLVWGLTEDESELLAREIRSWLLGIS